jgi:hypothetical protein
VIGASEVKKTEAQAAMPVLCEKWAKETGEPWPPDGKHHYSFSTFWSWLENNHRPYSQFKAEPDARYVADMWFEKITKQAWRN